MLVLSITALQLLVIKILTYFNIGLAMSNQLCDDVFSEIPLLINESDLHVSQVRDFSMYMPMQIDIKHVYYKTM